jgi:hypothetical protein
MTVAAVRWSAMRVPREPHLAWLWQAAMAAIIVAALGGVKPVPQILLFIGLVAHVVVQRVFAADAWSRRLRTGLLVLSTWIGVSAVGYITASVAMPRPEHPVMPIAEFAVGMLAGTSCAVLVLWGRWRRSDPWAESEAGPAVATEPRLRLIAELFALAVAVVISVDAME